MATRARIQKGPFGITCANLLNIVDQYLRSCLNCMIPAGVNYSRQLGNRTVGLKFNSKVIANISVDPIGGIKLLPFQGARRSVELIPLVIACRMTGAVDIILLDGMKTKNVLLGLLLIETRYNSITSITSGAVSDLINILNETPAKDNFCAAEQKKNRKE